MKVTNIYFLINSWINYSALTHWHSRLMLSSDSSVLNSHYITQHWRIIGHVSRTNETPLFIKVQIYLKHLRCFEELLKYLKIIVWSSLCRLVWYLEYKLTRTEFLLAKKCLVVWCDFIVALNDEHKIKVDRTKMLINYSSVSH